MYSQAEECLSRYCDDFRGEHSRIPDEVELGEFVRANASEPDSPFSSLREEARDELIRGALVCFQSNEVREDEISVKARDANANLHYRKYNDANF